jgi:hypothetical protein
MLTEGTPTNGHGEVFKLPADAVQEHLHSAVDADTVRQIARETVDERVSQADFRFLPQQKMLVSTPVPG